MARPSALILALAMLAAPARALDCSSYDGDEASCNGCLSAGECVWKSGKCMTDANSASCKGSGPAITSVGDECPGLMDSEGRCVPSWCLSWFDGCNTCGAMGEALACTEMFCDVPEGPAKCVEGKVPCPDGLYDAQGECAPKDCATWFDGCNTCKNDGKELSCTRKGCVVYGESKCMDEEPKGDGIVDENGNEVTPGCESWFDGCNRCTVDEEKGILGCTKKACFEPGKAFCADSEACADSASWHKRDATEKKCAWVSEDAKKRCLVKAEGGIYAFEECKATCGTCGASCVDDPSWHKPGRPAANCAWAKRTIQRCAVFGETGDAAYEACKFTCNTCEP